jgi:hypothetical protein
MSTHSPTPTVAVLNPAFCAKPDGAHPRYDVGGYRRLSVTEIAREAGVTRQAVNARIRRGIRGPALLMPAGQGRPRIVVTIDGQPMTVRQIANHTGMTPQGVRDRILVGYRGKALLARKAR